MNVRTVFFVLILVLAACSRRPADVKGFPPDFKPMQEAYAEARRTVPSFIKKLQSRDPRLRYLVKVRVEADGAVEYVWIEPVSFDGQTFSGPIANDFVKIKTVKKGQNGASTIDSVYDWAVVDSQENVLEGGYTIRVMADNVGKAP